MQALPPWATWRKVEPILFVLRRQVGMGISHRIILTNFANVNKRQGKCSHVAKVPIAKPGNTRGKAQYS